MKTETMWRREPPDLPGWWWRLAECGTSAVLLRIAYRDGALCLSTLEDNSTKVTEYPHGWWAGPVLPPVLPAAPGDETKIFLAPGV